MDEIKFKNFVKNKNLNKSKDGMVVEINYRANIQTQEKPGYLIPYDANTFSRTFLIETSERPREFVNRVQEAIRVTKPDGQITVEILTEDCDKLAKILGKDFMSSVGKITQVLKLKESVHVTFTKSAQYV